MILAAMRIGAVAVPVNTMLTGHELAELLRDTRTRITFVSAEFAATAAQAAADAPELRDVVLPRPCRTVVAGRRRGNGRGGVPGPGSLSPR